MTEATSGPPDSAPPPAPRLVTGTVTDGGRPAAGIPVALAARRLRSTGGLGETRTDGDGRYRLEYEPPDDPAGLVVSVSSPDGRSAEASCPAPRAEEVLDVVLPADTRGEYARVRAALAPLLDGADPAGLSPEEVGFLGHAAGVEPEHVRLFAAAARLAAGTGQPPEPFYGLLRRGLPDDPGDLALRPLGAVRRALAVAAEARLIDTADGADELLAALRARQLSPDGPAAVDGSLNGARPTALARLFTIGVTDPEVRRRLFSAHLDHDGPEGTAHEALLTVDAPPAATERLRLALELSRVADGHPELVGALLDRFDSGELAHPRELVRLDGHWEGLVAEAGGPLPTSPAGYADELRARTERTYPTAYVAHRLATDARADSAPAARFLAANPDFDLLSTPVDARSVPDEEARPELAAVQRVYRVAPRFDAMRALRDQGFSSSAAIAGLSRETFAARMAEHLDEEEAHAVHTRALRVHAAAVNLVADLRTAGQFDVPWLPRVEAHTDLVPDWGELFGSADQCACKECRTLYSQPAYLVDLLHFLKRAPSAGTMGELGESPMADTLYSRRPDLWHTKLSCDNTNLTLPYIDLVNEVLENAIIQNPATGDKLRQSSGDSARLRIQPQWTNHSAYSWLATAPYPWTLPYDLWADRARSYLGMLGVRREELMATLHPAGADSVEVVAESLGISMAGLRMITGEASGPTLTLAGFYGKPFGMQPAQLIDILSTVRAMLDTAQLDYPELESVLDTRFVDPGRVLRIEPTDPNHPCTTELLRINGLTADTLDRLHRFERLRRLLDWPAHRLDRLIAACTPGELTATTLSCVVAVRRLSERFGLPVERLLCLYGPLDTHLYRAGDDPSLYDRLFLDDTVIAALPGGRNPFTLNASRTEVETPGDLRSYPVSAALLGSLEITDAELATLVGGPRAVVADTGLTLANLSALVRTVTLARAVRLPVADLLRLFELRGGSPLRPGGRPADDAAALGDGETELPAGRPVRLSPSPVEEPGLRESSVGAGGPVGEPPAAGDTAASVRASLAETDRFADEVEAVLAAGLTVAEVDAVLTATTGAEGSTVPSDSALGSVLTGLRAALRAVYEQTAQTADDKGRLTGRQLSLLGWEPARVEQAVATLLGTAVYSVQVANDVGSRPYPADLPVRFEPGPDGQGLLRFTGPMTLAQKQRMYDLGSGELWGIYVRKLFAGPRDFVTTQMNAYRIPVYRTPLTTMPADLVLPPELVGKVFHDPSAQTLCSVGHRGQDEIDALLAASGDEHFQRAVHLLQGAQSDPVEGDNKFLDMSDADALFDDPQAPADRFRHVLSVLLPELRRRLSETTVKLQLGQATGLDAASADALLGTWLRSLSEPGPLVLDFLAPAFVGSDPTVAVTRTGFPVQFTALSLLYRVALALSRPRVTGEELPWVMGYAAGAGWLDLATLPTARVEGASPLYRPFVRLLALLALRAALPGGSGTLGAALTAGRGPEASGYRVFDTLHERAGWNRQDIEVLCTADMLGMALPGELGDERGLGKLRAAVALLRRLGVSAARAAAWIPSQLALDVVQSTMMAAKARFSPEDWLTAAIPVADGLRERQRAALVAYLVANPLTTSVGFPYWKDVNGLYDHFLLDVEQSGCRLTTRMAQAINTVQLFVQRVLLGLEPRVTAGDDATWKQWEWMKRYRLWEANQKVFLYPENWFQPDLRAGASPFFGSLCDELMQKEVVGEHMEEVYRNYVDRLGSVARLHPCAIHHDWSTGTEVAHLFACTDSAPRTFHHRRWIKNRTTWTPWEKIELDIDTLALVPVVWNKRLHLMWPTFVKVGDAQPISRLPDPMVEGSEIQQPDPYWKIQLNWTQYANGAWQPKRITQDTITTIKWPQRSAEDEANPFQNTGPYRFFPQIDPTGGELTVWSVHNFASFINPDPVRGTFSGGFRFGPRTGAVSVVPSLFVHENDPRHNLRGQRFIAPTDTQNINNEFVQHLLSNAPAGYRCQVYLPEITQFWGSDLVLANPQDGHLFRIQLPVAFSSATGWFQDSATVTDGARSYHVTADTRTTRPLFRFTPMYHPQVDLFTSLLDHGGTDALFDRSVQLDPGAQWPFFDFASYGPQDNVSPERPSETDVDFTPEGTYADYNWELFFHIPLLMAQRLGANQRFAEAQQWFHRIFDPTSRSGGESPARYWITKPFHLRKDYQRERIEDILRRLAEGSDEGALRQVEEWLENPFQPDVVARFRTTAYQKAVVMRYLDNLIAWGDQLFREGTLESVNLATQMYLLAAELLGRRPASVPPPNEPAPLSYAELRARDAAAPGPVTAAEHLIPVGGTQPPPATISPGLGLGWLNYFRIPPNDKLLGYWDTVEDRLYKIRHCQDIEGVQRAFELFGAPIDPALLVGAVASGADLASVAEDLGGPLPHYRFATMAAKAREYTAEVKSFGALLLAALEKRDAEALARLRSSHETSLLDAVREVRLAQVTEAAHTVAGLQQAREGARRKQDYYAKLNKMNAGEKTHEALSWTGIGIQGVAAAVDMTVSVMRLLPELKLGTPTTIGATWGGTNLGEALKGLSGSLSQIAGSFHSGASLAATLAGYERRSDDWGFQKGQAESEMANYDAQIEAAVVRHENARRELANHDLQAAHTREADRFLHDKYTGQELYDWMVGQLSTSYFQAYQLAYETAKRAERAMRYELGTDGPQLVRFGHWDTLRKGLLAGERLASDLNRLDAAYLADNAREFELAKSVSLAQLDPNALLALKETGSCYVSLPEALFDLDAPGHYLRRIKTVSFTVPCVGGPYTSVNLTATLMRSSVRTDPRLPGNRYARQTPDARFRDYAGPVQSVVTSTGQDDSGLFETNLRDERFLPFEGAGVVGEWRLQLPGEFRQFDYESIADVVMHLRYTARDGGAEFADRAVSELRDGLNNWLHAHGGKGLLRAFSARRELGDQWYRFVSGTSPTLRFPVSKRWFPRLFSDDGIALADPRVVLVLSTDLVPDGTKRYVDCYGSGTGDLTVTLTSPGGAGTPATLTADPQLKDQPLAHFDVDGRVAEHDEDWLVTVPLEGLDPLLRKDGGLNPDAVVDLMLVWQYEVTRVA